MREMRQHSITAHEIDGHSSQDLLHLGSGQPIGADQPACDPDARFPPLLITGSWVNQACITVASGTG